MPLSQQRKESTLNGVYNVTKVSQCRSRSKGKNPDAVIDNAKTSVSMPLSQQRKESSLASILENRKASQCRSRSKGKNLSKRLRKMIHLKSQCRSRSKGKNQVRT